MGKGKGRKPKELTEEEKENLLLKQEEEKAKQVKDAEESVNIK